MTDIPLLVAGAAEAAPALGNPFLSEGVLIALITTVGGILTLLLGKLSFDLARVKKSSAKTHQLSAKVENSINNRDTPLSDRLDAVMKAVEGVASTQTEQSKKLDYLKNEQQEQGRDIRGLRKDDGLLRSEVREVRENLSEHLSTSEESMSLIRRIVPHISKMESCKGSTHNQQ